MVLPDPSLLSGLKATSWRGVFHTPVVVKIVNFRGGDSAAPIAPLAAAPAHC